MPNYNTTGLVLHRLNFGEADRVLTIFSNDSGKISVIAKGCRKPASRTSGATELFTYSKFLLGHGRSMDIVSQCEIIQSFPEIRDNILKLACASYLCELLDRSTQEHDNLASAELLHLTLTALAQLEANSDYQDGIVHAYELRLMEIQGYAPVLMNCAVCGKTELGSVPGFSPTLGGVLCKDDRYRAQDCQQISMQAVQLLQNYAYSSQNDWPTQAPERQISREIDRALRWYIRFRIDREIKSLHFLDQLRAESE